MPLFFRLTFLFLIFSANAFAAYPTYRGLEVKSGGECALSILSQKDSYLEVLVTVTVKNELVYLEALTLQTWLKPAFRTRDYDRIDKIDTTYSLEFTKIYYKSSNVRFFDGERLQLSFRQWQAVQIRGANKPDILERTVTYNCPSLVRRP